MATDSPLQRLEHVRQALLALHKSLVDSERVSYERTVGTIPTPNDFLQLLIRDPWFAWLHPLSQLIVAIDEAQAAKDPPLTPAGADALMNQTRAMLIASEEGEGFPRQYFDALQRDPAVVLAHAAVMKELRPPR